MDRGDGLGAGPSRGHRSPHRRPLEGHPLHARRVRGQGHRTDRPGPRQDVGRVRQGAVPAVPQGPGQGRSQDRRHPQAPRLHLKGRPRMSDSTSTIEKVSIIVSKGSLDGVYPGLIMANGARAEGIEVNLFFTFFGLDAIHKGRHDHIKMATVGNPGLHFATMLGGLPGVSSVMTHYMNHKMEQLDSPSIPEFVEMIADTGAGLYACKASVDLFGLEKNDFIPQVQDIITVGEFYTLAAGGQIIFT